MEIHKYAICKEVRTAIDGVWNRLCKCESLANFRLMRLKEEMEDSRVWELKEEISRLKKELDELYSKQSRLQDLIQTDSNKYFDYCEYSHNLPETEKQREENLNEKQLQIIFNNVGIGIVELNADGKFIQVNDRICQILDYSREELLKLSIYEITAPDDILFSKEVHSKLQSRELKMYSFEKRYLKRDGTPLWVHLTVSGFYDQWGNYMSTIGTVEDISDRKKVEEALRNSEQRLEAIFNNAAVGIVELDIHSRFIMVNDRICAILGYSREELLEKTVLDITAHDDREHTRFLYEKLHSGEVNILSFEKKYIKSDNSLLWVHISMSAIRDGNGNHLRSIGTVKDISERKIAEEALRRSEHELKQKNEELTRFIYTISHDLKSPLVTIRSFAGFLKEDILNNNKESQGKDIAFIENAADKMEILLAELLELSRIGRKEPPKMEIPLRVIAQTALDLVAGRITQKNILVTFSGPPVMLYGYPQRLVQLYQNLLDNSAKFMGNQPEPLIEIGAYQDNERCQDIVLFVRDNGSGIESRYHKKLFGLFEKLDNSTEGTGIGLALIKRIVEVHGGKIWFTSEGTGQGTTFYFTINNTTIIDTSS